MSVGKMTLHRFNGDEIYSVESATIEYYKNEDGLFTVTFRADAAAAPIQTLPDTVELRARPWGEWTLTLPKIPAIALRPGSKFTIPHGHTDADGFVTNLYYCEHEPMDENEIELIEKDGRRIRARITGMATDVNYYDGSKPRTKVVVEADFLLGI